MKLIQDNCNTPLVTHNGYYQKPHPPNLLNTRDVIKNENIAKSGSTSFETSITRRGNMKLIQDIKTYNSHSRNYNAKVVKPNYDPTEVKQMG